MRHVCLRLEISAAGPAQGSPPPGLGSRLRRTSTIAPQHRYSARLRSGQWYERFIGQRVPRVSNSLYGPVSRIPVSKISRRMKQSLIVAMALLLATPHSFAQSVSTAPLDRTEILGRLAMDYSPSYIAQNSSPASSTSSGNQKLSPRPRSHNKARSTCSHNSLTLPSQSQCSP